MSRLKNWKPTQLNDISINPILSGVTLPRAKSKTNPFTGKAFYCWDEKKLVLDTCCFNHMIGLPEKNNKVYPLYDYEFKMQYEWEHNQHIWIKKSRGLGVTEWTCRYLAWVCVRDNLLTNKKIFILSGTREEFANKIKERIENLFLPRYKVVIHNSKYTETTINAPWLKVFPTKRLKDARGYTDLAYLFVDEADFFEEKEQEELPYVVKSYEEKSNCKIIMVSTPNKPLGMFEQIERQTEEECMYKRLFLDYTYGLDKVYERKFIEREQKRDPTFFEREYNLKYLGGVGNVFPPLAIDRCLDLGEQFKDYPTKTPTIYHAGVDPGFGSSRTAIVVTQWLPEYEVIKVIYSKEFHRPNMNEIADECFRLFREYESIYFWIDGSNAAFVTLLKYYFGEDTDYLNLPKEEIDPDHMRVLPIHFGTQHIALLTELHRHITKPRVAISRQDHNMIEISLRTAKSEEYRLDKDETSYNDTLDALRLACWGYRTVQ
jgi:hypothetical protein